MAEFLTRPEAANYLSERGFKITKGTLQKYATLGGGPVYRKFGNKVLYKPQDLNSWAKEKLSAPRRSTSQMLNAGV